MKFKTEFFNKWIENLTNGKYQQGQNYLCTIDDKGVRHCCIGVAEETLLELGWIPEDEVGYSSGGHGLGVNGKLKVYLGQYGIPHRQHITKMYDEEDFVPYESFRVFMPNPRDVPRYEEHDREFRYSLSALNDDVGLTFSQIADLLIWEQNKHVRYYNKDLMGLNEYGRSCEVCDLAPSAHEWMDLDENGFAFNCSLKNNK